MEAIGEEVCQGVYTHTADLLTKCPYLIYARLDSHCLLKILIDTLILPHQIFRKEYKPPKHVFDAITQHVDKILEGLLTLGKNIFKECSSNLCTLNLIYFNFL